MTETAVLERAPAQSETTHVDVLIVGAGISGIGAAYHLQEQCPAKATPFSRTKESFGGTWITHDYPGIRSDSDLYTFGYRFKPWVGIPIATRDEILKYMGEVIEENGIAPISAMATGSPCQWSSADNRWTVKVTQRDTGKNRPSPRSFLWMCQGYYDHESPIFPNGPAWRISGDSSTRSSGPEDLDIKGKRVIVIGSGATSATVVPSLQTSARTSRCCNARRPISSRTPTQRIGGSLASGRGR